MPNETNLGLRLQPVTVQINDVPYAMHYGSSEPEYVGEFPIRHDIVILPPDRDAQGNRIPLSPEIIAALGYLPADRDSQDNLDFLGNLPPPTDPDFGGHALQVTAGPQPDQFLVANSWGRSDWTPPDQSLQASPTGGLLFINGAPRNQDITFYSKDRVEVLKITETGDFIVQGRLVKQDVDVYNAFRVFLGLSMGLPPEPGSRDGIPNRYERILKKCTEG